MDELYRENILDHYKHPHNWGELDGADLEFHDLNPLCGDELTVQLAVDDGGVIEDVKFSGHGCAISQASASMASDEIKGMTVEDVLKLERSFVLDLLGIDISATRMKCALLSLKVLRERHLGTRSGGSPKPQKAPPASATPPRSHLGTGADPQQLQDFRGTDERVRDCGAVGERQRDAKFAIELGDEQRGGGNGVGAVDRREPPQGELVVRVRRADRDLWLCVHR